MCNSCNYSNNFEKRILKENLSYIYRILNILLQKSNLILINLIFKLLILSIKITKQLSKQISN